MYLFLPDRIEEAGQSVGRLFLSIYLSLYIPFLPKVGQRTIASAIKVKTQGTSHQLTIIVPLPSKFNYVELEASHPETIDVCPSDSEEVRGRNQANQIIKDLTLGPCV